MSTADWTCWRDSSHATTIHPDFGWPRCTECGAAPPYHERPLFLDPRLELTLYVPAPDARVRSMIAARSAIVGLPTGPERALVYLEGWINGPMQYADRDARGLWEAGVEHAASRMVCQYPTAGLLSPRLNELVAIGTFNPSSDLLDVTNEKALDEWLAGPAVDEREGWLG